jgi:ribosomal protein S12 methylthiotransferase accessory factor
MTTKTYIKGKDAPLEDTIEKIKSILTTQGFDIIEKSKKNPIRDVWSVHICAKENEILAVNGKGLSYKAALASALAEFVERFATNFFYADFYLGKDKIDSEFVFYKNEKWLKSFKDHELYSFYNTDNLLTDDILVDFNTGDYKRGICSLPFRRSSDNKEVFFPINILNNLYVSNGMAAGNTKHEAYLQALCEIIERFVKNKVIKECLSLPVVPEDVLNKNFPKIKSIKKDLSDRGYDLDVYDSSLGGIFPVISVCLFDKKNNTVFVSFGSHLSLNIAIERTITELLQGRELDDFLDLKKPVFDKELVCSDENLIDHFINSTGYIHWNFFSNKKDYEFVLWDYTFNNEEGFKYLCDLLNKQEKDIYIADYNYNGFDVCRIIIPGFSEIYPVSDLVYNNTSLGVSIRDQILNFKNLNKQECMDLLDLIEQQGFAEYENIARLIGLYPGSEYDNITIGDIKLSLFLFLGKKDQASYVLDTLINSSECNHINLYKCMQDLINMEDDFGKYNDSLNKIYGKDVVGNAVSIVLENLGDRLLF